MLKQRGAGVLLHISSMPSPYGIGVFDDNIKKFISNLNEILKEIVENGALNDNCLTPEEGGTIHEWKWSSRIHRKSGSR